MRKYRRGGGTFCEALCKGRCAIFGNIIKFNGEPGWYARLGNVKYLCYIDERVATVCFFIMHLKIGIIGLGDIATKAYLPVIGKKNLEFHLFTRDENRLKRVGEQYRFQNRHQNLRSLMDSGIKAAFVHSSTGSHFPIVEELLKNNIHVYVDKPVTYHLETTEKLVDLAQARGLILMAGFNRRYAPAYVNLKNLNEVNMIIMQKNRKSLPGDVRTFVFDDFIHVVDTLLFLFPYPAVSISVNGRKKDGLLHHVVIQLHAGNGATAIGIMNRDSGTVEEKVEIFTPAEKWVVKNVSETTVLKADHSLCPAANDWESTLHKRGFEQITDHFLGAVAEGSTLAPLHQDLLRTHEVCEQVVRELLA